MIHYLLLLVPLPSLAGFVLLALDPWRIPRRRVIAIAVLAAVGPALILFPVSLACFSGLCGDEMIVPIFTVVVGEATVALALGLDPLSAVAGNTVTVVGACVLLYSVDYMADVETPDLRRFFALMNLFMVGMLAVVLAADTVSLFLGWELMGLCSFFLIAYQVTSSRAFARGRKAFVMTRIADAALLAGLLLLFIEAGDIRLDTLIPAGEAAEGPFRSVIAALLLVGALGKSAQLPFQTWLPTAMAGPTPVSALLHSATMVAAGAFLLARFAPILETTPAVSAATAIAGVATALFGSVCAVAQLDVKRLLAFSSLSQIGLMVLAVGIGAPEVAMAHFVVHAAFKSLLFMAAGVMAHSAGGDTSIAALAGGRQRNPLAFWTFTAGAASLSGLPIVTAGWWSKEALLSATFETGLFGLVLWSVAVGASLLTGAYAFRPVFAASRSGTSEVSGGAAIAAERHSHDATHHEGLATALPLFILAAASLALGLAVEPIVVFLGGHAAHPALLAEFVGAAAALGGVTLAAWIERSPRLTAGVLHARHIRYGFRMDARYYVAFVRPFRRLTGSSALAARLPIPSGSSRSPPPRACPRTGSRRTRSPISSSPAACGSRRQSRGSWCPTGSTGPGPGPLTASVGPPRPPGGSRLAACVIMRSPSPRGLSSSLSSRW